MLILYFIRAILKQWFGEALDEARLNLRMYKSRRGGKWQL
jgi:hypothetical protein